MPRLYHKFSFQKRISQGNDGIGNDQSDWVEQFSTRSRKTILRGGEEVISSRLSGTQTAVLTVRSQPNTKLVDSFWRAVDSRTGEAWNVMTNEPADDRLYIDMLVKTGVALG